MNYLSELFFILFTALIGGLTARLVNLPLFAGYLAAGTASRFLYPQILTDANISLFAQIGVILMLFGVGLEFSPKRLSAIGKIASLGAILQISATTLILYFLTGFIIGYGLPAFFIAAVFSLSSTAMVIKVLSDRRELDTLYGEAAAGILIAQDIAVLPISIIFLSLSQNRGSDWNFLYSLFSSLLSAGIFILLALLLSRLLLSFAVRKVASVNSRELVLAGSLSLTFLFAYLTESMGMSAAVGAFLAGVAASGLFSRQAFFAEIRPLRDLFGLVFFVSMGILLAPDFFAGHILTIIFLAGCVIAVKFAVIFFLALFFRYHPKTAFSIALPLSQVGEFAFILGQMGLSSGIINADEFSLIISTAAVTLFIIPPFIGLNYQFYRRLYFFRKKFNFGNSPPQKTSRMSNSSSVVLAGFGRVGSHIGRALGFAGISYTVIDYDHRVIAELTKQSASFVYGDPAESEVLEYAGVKNAKAMIVAVPDRHTQTESIIKAKKLNPQIKIICRAHYAEDQKHLKFLGADLVIQPEFEASLTIVEKLLSDFGVPEKEIAGKITRLKIEHGMV